MSLPDNLFPDDLPPERSREQQTMAVMGSSKDMTWPTPQEWFDYLDLEFGFTLDPCCVRETAKCDMFYTPETDGLAHAWTGHRVFMNPPYGTEIGRWMEKAYNECRRNGVLVVAFVPARVDTAWWHDFAAKSAEVRFPRGRVKNPDAIAWPFPIAIVIFRPRVDAAREIEEYEAALSLTRAYADELADVLRSIFGQPDQSPKGDQPGRVDLNVGPAWVERVKAVLTKNPTNTREAVALPTPDRNEGTPAVAPRNPSSELIEMRSFLRYIADRGDCSREIAAAICAKLND